MTVFRISLLKCYESKIQNTKSVTPDIQTPENVFSKLKTSRQGTDV